MRAPSYGVEVFAAGAPGARKPQRCRSEMLWTFQGMPTHQIEPVKVRPGTRAEFLLDLKALRTMDGNPVNGAVTLECSTARGRRVFSYTCEKTR